MNPLKGSAIQVTTRAVMDAIAKELHGTGRAARPLVVPHSIPLHGNTSARGAEPPTTVERLSHLLTMQALAPANFKGEPRGFRIAPTSPKSPKTRSKRPTTRAERLAAQAFQ